MSITGNADRRPMEPIQLHWALCHEGASCWLWGGHLGHPGQSAHLHSCWAEWVPTSLHLSSWDGCCPRASETEGVHSHWAECSATLLPASKQQRVALGWLQLPHREIVVIWGGHCLGDIKRAEQHTLPPLWCCWGHSDVWVGPCMVMFLVCKEVPSKLGIN